MPITKQEKYRKACELQADYQETILLDFSRLVDEYGIEVSEASFSTISAGCIWNFDITAKLHTDAENVIAVLLENSWYHVNHTYDPKHPWLTNNFTHEYISIGFFKEYTEIRYKHPKREQWAQEVKDVYQSKKRQEREKAEVLRAYTKEQQKHRVEYIR